MDYSKNENSLLAVMWFVLALVVACFGIYIMFTPGKYLVASFLGLSFLLFVIGRQRLKLYQLEPDRFKMQIRNLGLFIAMASAIGGTVTANV